MSTYNEIQRFMDRYHTSFEISSRYFEYVREGYTSPRALWMLGFGK